MVTAPWSKVLRCRSIQPLPPVRGPPRPWASSRCYSVLPLSFLSLQCSALNFLSLQIPPPSISQPFIAAPSMSLPFKSPPHFSAPSMHARNCLFPTVPLRCAVCPVSDPHQVPCESFWHYFSFRGSGLWCDFDAQAPLVRGAERGLRWALPADGRAGLQRLQRLLRPAPSRACQAVTALVALLPTVCRVTAAAALVGKLILLHRITSNTHDARLLLAKYRG